MRGTSGFPERVEYTSFNATMHCHGNRNKVRYEVNYYDLDGLPQRVTVAAYSGAPKSANTVVEELAKNRTHFVTLRGVVA